MLNPVSVIEDAAIFLICTKQRRHTMPWYVPCRKWHWREIYDSWFVLLYCGDLKERIHLLRCSDAQPCRMTHSGANGTDVNRGRAQVGLTCTCSSNGRPRSSTPPPFFSPTPSIPLVRRRVNPGRGEPVGAASRKKRRSWGGCRGERKKMINLSKANLFWRWERTDIRPSDTSEAPPPRHSVTWCAGFFRETGVTPMLRHSRWFLCNRPGSRRSSPLPDLAFQHWTATGTEGRWEHRGNPEAG